MAVPQTKRVKVVRSGEAPALWTGCRRRPRRAAGRHHAPGRARAVGLDPRAGRPARQRGPRTRHQGDPAGSRGHGHRRRSPTRVEVLEVDDAISFASDVHALLRQRGHRTGAVLPDRVRARRRGGRRRPRPAMTDARDPGRLEEFLAGASVDDAVAALRPDYRAAPHRRRRPHPARRRERQARNCSPAPRPSRPSSWPTRRWRSSRMSRRGGRRTGRSAPSHNAPATASKRSCAVPASGLPRVNRAHRHLQRHQRHPPGPARWRGPRPVRRPAPARPRHRRRGVRHHRRRRRRSSSTPSRVRSSGATTRA